MSCGYLTRIFTWQPALEPVKVALFGAAVSSSQLRVEREVDSLSSQAPSG